MLNNNIEVKWNETSQGNGGGVSPIIIIQATTVRFFFHLPFRIDSVSLVVGEHENRLKSFYGYYWF